MQTFAFCWHVSAFLVAPLMVICGRENLAVSILWIAILARVRVSARLHGLLRHSHLAETTTNNVRAPISNRLNYGFKPPSGFYHELWILLSFVLLCHGQNIFYSLIAGPQKPTKTPTTITFAFAVNIAECRVPKPKDLLERMKVAHAKSIRVCRVRAIRTSLLSGWGKA